MLAKMFVPIRQNSKEKRIFNEHSIWLIMYRVLFHRQNLIVNKSGMHFYCIFTTWHVACKLRGSGYCYDSSDCLCAMALSKQLYGSISFFCKGGYFWPVLYSHFCCKRVGFPENNGAFLFNLTAYSGPFFWVFFCSFFWVFLLTLQMLLAQYDTSWVVDDTEQPSWLQHLSVSFRENKALHRLVSSAVM